MIIGDPSIVAVESEITQAYERESLRALGFFVLHIGGRSYGVRAPDATMLACSFDAIGQRIDSRGCHVAPFANRPAAEVADAVCEALFAPDTEGKLFMGLSSSVLADLIASKHLLWAPDGDSAFDDSSYVLHFDVQDSVRVIAFRSGEGFRHDPATLNDIWVNADLFYAILLQWHDLFEREWRSRAKDVRAERKTSGLDS